MRPDVELREIRVFLTLADELHFGRTAERIGIVPSRVSQTIRTLETRLGARLFERTSRRVCLTPTGEQLLADVGPLYRRLEQVVQQTREVAAGVAGTIRIGAYATMMLGPRMPEIIKLFGERHPACHATYVDVGIDRDYLDWLRAGDVDLVACWLPVSPPELTVGPVLFREERVLIVARDHPLAQRATVTLEDLAEYPVSDVPAFSREMMDTFIPPVTPRGVRLRRVAPRTIEETVMRCALGEQVHPTTTGFLEHYTNPRITAVPFSDLPPLEAALVWRAADRSPKTHAFVRAATDVLAHTELGPRATQRQLEANRPASFAIEAPIAR